MKKIVALLLMLTIIISLTATALAKVEKSGTTVITAVVPEPDYTISIPADTTMTYGDSTNYKDLGRIYVSQVKNLTTVNCTVSGTSLRNGTNYITISYSWKINDDEWKSAYVLDGSNKQLCTCELFNSNRYNILNMKAYVMNWLPTEPGTYTATLTFNFIGE